MPQVSRKKLDKDIEREMFNLFWKSLARLKDSSITSQFFSDLLTETEKIMLAKRFTVAVLLARGKTATEIKNSINVTYSTVGSVSSWLKNAKPKTKKIMGEISKEKDWEAIGDRIDELLDKLPPRYGTNWSEAGKQKWKRTQQRAARMALR